MKHPGVVSLHDHFSPSPCKKKKHSTHTVCFLIGRLSDERDIQYMLNRQKRIIVFRKECGGGAQGALLHPGPPPPPPPFPPSLLPSSLSFPTVMDPDMGGKSSCSSDHKALMHGPLLFPSTQRELSLPGAALGTRR